MSKTIMAVGAHTGDAQLTCGMLLAKHAMHGDRVVIVDLTAGERGTPGVREEVCRKDRRGIHCSGHTGRRTGGHPGKGTGTG